MADTYTIVTQRPDVETLGGQLTRNVMVVGTVTRAHGVYFERRYPRATFSETIAQQDAYGFTIVFEDLFKIPGVADVAWSQEITPGNQLQDHVIVYYTSTSGDSSNYVDVPFSRFTQDYIAGLVKKGRAVLDANEAA
jgi:hypothetical protein